MYTKKSINFKDLSCTPEIYEEKLYNKDTKKIRFSKL